ncbi:MAG: ethanolamine utilization protein EutH, partial [Planctomycetes bacterium]|nr:ethanolamine utilization protein EutH [Planctomycetota bacterium]
MALFGWIVISVVLVSAVLGAIAACRDDEKGLGKEFLEGIYAIGYIFLPVAGIMASVPFLSALIRKVFGPTFAAIGADPQGEIAKFCLNYRRGLDFDYCTAPTILRSFACPVP